MHHGVALNSGGQHWRQPRSSLFALNDVLLSCLWLVDIVFNASIEFGDLPGQHSNQASAASNSNTILTMVQALLQVFALVDFFAMLGATFLFRSGLFSLLYREFRPIILVHPAYILLTVFLGMNHLNAGAQLIEIWDMDGYPVLSCVQKLGAVLYYACSVRAIEKLRHRKFYSHDHWMR